MPSYAAVLQILQMIMVDASYQRISKALKNVPELIVQILRLANSGSQAHSQPKPISSVRQALAFAGGKKVLQWCSLLLYANPVGLPVEEDSLALLASRRGLFMLRAVEAFAPTWIQMQQAALLTGLLSLLRVVHGVELDAFVSTLPVSEEIRAAVVRHHGKLGTLLRITELLEQGRYAAAYRHCDEVAAGLAAQLTALCPVLGPDLNVLPVSVIKNGSAVS